jgi:hypothetical protein
MTDAEPEYQLVFFARIPVAFSCREMFRAGEAAKGDLAEALSYGCFTMDDQYQKPYGRLPD